MNIGYKYPLYLIALSFIIFQNSCSRKPTDYRSYLNGEEKIYPGGVISNVEVSPGANRVLLSWVPNSDPSITKYIIYWNSGMDSLIIENPSYHSLDTVKTYINNIEEANHNFVVYFFNAKGDKSIPTKIQNVRVYGDKYRGGLLNRSVSEVTYSDNVLKINWNVPDTINVTTEVLYTNTSDEVKAVYLSPDSNTLQLADWKLPTRILYKSYYKPQTNAIDTFNVANYDSLSISSLPVDKSSWSHVVLANDAVVNAWGTSLSNIWDGQPGNHPKIYHTDGKEIPHTFTIDLGKTYDQLTRFSEWGRGDCKCGNPLEFEVWGIADITGAATVLPASDAGWKEEAVAKGWTMLAHVKRSDDGIAGVDVDIIDNPPPVRFVRFRILKNYDGSKNSMMSEISFWYKP